MDNKRKTDFVIESSAFKAAKGQSRGNIKCKVERFKRNTELTIKNWSNRMKTYFPIGLFFPEALVGVMLI